MQGPFFLTLLAREARCGASLTTEFPLSFPLKNQARDYIVTAGFEAYGHDAASSTCPYRNTPFFGEWLKLYQKVRLSRKGVFLQLLGPPVNRQPFARRRDFDDLVITLKTGRSTKFNLFIPFSYL